MISKLGAEISWNQKKDRRETTFAWGNQRSWTSLGFAGYYGDHSSKGSRRSKDEQHRKSCGEPFQWSQEYQTAFETLIERLSSILAFPDPILAFPDFNFPFILHTDASGYRLGRGALHQVEDGKPRVIAYGSRSLNVAGGRYSAYRHEFLGLKRFFSENFKQCLYGNKFHVMADSGPLTYLLLSA